MQEKFINATQTQTTTQVSTKTKVLLGLMIAASVAGMFAIAGSINKSIKEPMGAEIKDTAEGSGHCCANAGGGACKVGTPCVYEATYSNEYGDIWDQLVECTCIPNAGSAVGDIPNIKGTAEGSGHCCANAGGGACKVGTYCDATYTNEYGDIQDVGCDCIANPGTAIGSTPNIKSGGSNLTTNYPITNEVKQKSIITRLDNGKIRYDYIIGKNGEIITPQIKDIDGGGNSSCACHLGPCGCPSTCVSSHAWDYNSDEYEETGHNIIVSQCRVNYAGTSGYTHSEINGVVTE